MVVRRKNKNGKFYYYNKRTKKITCKRCWKISLTARKKKKKKQITKVVTKKPVAKKVKKPKKEETPDTEQYFNQTITTVVKKYLLVLDYDVYVSCAGVRKRLFKNATDDFKRLIEDILDDYYDFVERKRIPSPHSIFILKHWRKKKEIEVLIDHTEFVGAKNTDIDLCKHFRKYFG